jgi:phosphoglucosamine mutase
MKQRGERLSKLKQCWTRYPQLVTNVKVREKKPFEQLDGVMDLVAKAEALVKPHGGRVFLRYSGTEPKARLLMEGPDEAVLKQWSSTIIDAIKKQVGAHAQQG